MANNYIFSTQKYSMGDFWEDYRDKNLIYSRRDIISFLFDREVNPDKYIAPENWYKYGNQEVKPFKIRILPDFISYFS